MTDHDDPKKLLDELGVRAAERAHDRNDTFFDKTLDAAITAASLTLRMSLLLNGGAAISLLTFIGSLPAYKKPIVAGALVWFAWGAVASVAGFALAYVTHYITARAAASRRKIWNHPYVADTAATKIWQRVNYFFHCATMLVGVAALGLFINGIFMVQSSILQLY